MRKLMVVFPMQILQFFEGFSYLGDHFIDGLMAFLRRLAHSFEGNGVQARSQLTGSDRVLSRYHTARRAGVLLTDDALDLGVRNTVGESIWRPAGENLIKKHPQRVDIGREAHELSPNLLRA